MYKWFVYQHISPNGKVYVGITSKPRPNDRWESGTGYARCPHFEHAIKKYGWDNIKHEILLTGVSKSEAVYAEKYLIKWYKSHGNSYNITDGGDGCQGMKLSEETKRKISFGNKGKNIGKVRSEEMKKKLSIYNSKPIEQIDISSGIVIAEYISAKQAAIEIGHMGHENNIAHVLHNRSNTAFGYGWRFKKQSSK